MNALVPTKNNLVEKSHRLMAPAIHAMTTGGDRPLMSTKLPNWRQIQQIAESVKEGLGKRTDAPDALSLIKILVGARVNAKMAKPDIYLRAVKHRLVNCPPDVAAEAVHNLVTSNKYMPEVAELEDAIQTATFKRRQIVQACRAAWKEAQKRGVENSELEHRESERAGRDECWDAWFTAFRGGRAVTFEEFQREWKP